MTIDSTDTHRTTTDGTDTHRTTTDGTDTHRTTTDGTDTHRTTTDRTPTHQRAQRLAWLLLLILGLLGIADTVALLTYTNLNVGTLLPGAVGLLFVGCAALKLTRYRRRLIIANRPLRRLLAVGLTLVVLSFALVETFILINTRSEDGVRADYVIILGAAVKGDTVSLLLKERLDKGIAYLKDNPQAKVVVTGGRGLGEQVTEAEAMRRYLVAGGIARDRVIEEDRATSTMENFTYTRLLLPDAPGGGKPQVMIVTSDFHMLRAKLLARRNGLIAYGITCPTPPAVRVNSYAREYLAWIKSYLFDR
jgi:uncharacterized SAM-binding protein YcdF (DUF218 family)